MASDLAPQWNPIPLPVACTWPGTSLAAPLLIPERGVLVAGGPRALCVFQVFRRQRLWFTIPAQVGIAGCAASAAVLYVQDGPVLAAWDLTYGGCFAAINLATGAAWQNDDGKGAAAVPASLFQGAPGAAAYSAPVARADQIGAYAGATVFVLDANGTLHALDDDLRTRKSVSFEAPPLRLELTLAEVAQPGGGEVLCRLYYVTAAGGIAAIDGSALPPKPLPGWAPSQTPDPARVLPLRYVDHLLFGGGILGDDFFVRTLDPAQPPIRTVAGPGDGWRRYDVAIPEKLVIVCADKAARLVSYDPAAKQPDRWRLRETPASAWWVACAGTGGDVQPPTARLVLELDVVADGDIAPGFRVLLGNTVDSTNPALTPDYPPATPPLDVGGIAQGPFPGLSFAAWIRSVPVIHDQVLYCVISTTPAFLDGGHDALVAFAIAPITAAAQPAAQAQLAQLRDLAHPVQLVVDWMFVNPEIPETTGPHPRPGATVLVTAPGGSVTRHMADGNSVVWIETSLVGAVAHVDLTDPAWAGGEQWGDVKTADPITLARNDNRIRVTWTSGGAP